MPDHKLPPMAMTPNPPASPSVPAMPVMEYEYAAQNSFSIDVFDFIHTILKRKWWVIGTFLVVFLGALCYVLFSTPIYRTFVTLQITEDKSSSQFSTSDMLNQLTGNDIEKFQTTQYKILESRSLAKGVFDALNLKNHPYFQRIKEDNPDLNASEIEALMLHDFRERLDVTPIKNSFLVEVSFLFPDKIVGRNVANAFANEYICLSVDRRNESMMFVRKWLNKQLQDLASTVQNVQKKLYQFSQKNDIYTPDEKDNVFIQKYIELSDLLTKAQADKMAKAAEYQQIKEKGPNSPLIVNNPLVVALRQQLVSQQAKVSSMAKIYRGEHPELQAEQANMNALQSRLAAEIQRIEDSAKANYEAAKRTEQLLSDSIEDLKGQLAKLQEHMVDFQILKRDVGTSETLYQALLARVKEANISATMIPANVTTIDHAVIPDKTYRPRPLRDMAAASVLGLILGIGLAFLVERLDNSIRSVEEMELACNLPVLGVLPLFSVTMNGHHKRKQLLKKGGKVTDFLPQLRRGQPLTSGDHEVIVVTDPQSPATEAIRHTHTAVMLSISGQPPKIIMVTSPNPGEGKSLFTSNLAALFGMGKKRTVLIDCDLRKPCMHKIFKLTQKPGVSDYLVGQATLQDVIRETSIPNLSIIPAGTAPPSPSNLLNSQEFKALLQKLGEEYDQVFIDTPPVLSFSDGLIISVLADAVLLVVKHNSTQKSAGRLAVQLLNQVHAPVMGTVLNGVDSFGSRYGSYYYYRRYSY